MVLVHPAGGVLQGLALGSGQVVKCGFEVGLGQLQPGHTVGGQAIEAGGVVENNSVASPARLPKMSATLFPDASYRCRMTRGSGAEATLKLASKLDRYKGFASILIPFMHAQPVCPGECINDSVAACCLTWSTARSPRGAS